MSIELVTKILDSKNITNREKQVLLSIYRLQFDSNIKKINSSALSKYTGDKLDRMCKFVKGLQEKHLICRDTPRGTIKINWSKI